MGCATVHSGGGIMTGHAALSGKTEWRTGNITPAERVARIVIGLAAIAAGFAGNRRQSPSHRLTSPLFLLVAVGCTAMMAMVMVGMRGGGSNEGGSYR